MVYYGFANIMNEKCFIVILLKTVLFQTEERKKTYYSMYTDFKTIYTQVQKQETTFKFFNKVIQSFVINVMYIICPITS